MSLVFKYSEKSSTSYISKLVLSNVISYESFLIFDSFLGIINKHNQVADDIIWSDFSIKLKAYRKIFDLTEKDIIKYRNLMKQTLIKLN
ncbi:loader of DNA helicase [Klebsiella phage CPRSA]|nr:loader of DNA helicase [Klebsiella phage CPRSA]